MASALDVANSARAQIRRPVNSQARVTISIVDTNGAILGVVRTRDALCSALTYHFKKRVLRFCSQAQTLLQRSALRQTTRWMR